MQAVHGTNIPLGLWMGAVRMGPELALGQGFTRAGFHRAASLPKRYVMWLMHQGPKKAAQRSAKPLPNTRVPTASNMLPGKWQMANDTQMERFWAVGGPV